MSTPSDTFSGIRIHAGPFSENGKTVYYYEVCYIDNDGPALSIEAQERRKIKFQANVTRAYAVEKPPRFAPNEYRRLFRAPLPTEAYLLRPDQQEVAAITAAIAAEHDRYLRASQNRLDHVSSALSA